MSAEVAILVWAIITGVLTIVLVYLTYKIVCYANRTDRSANEMNTKMDTLINILESRLGMRPQDFVKVDNPGWTSGSRKYD